MEVVLNEIGTNVMGIDRSISHVHTPRKVPSEVMVSDIIKNVKPEYGRFLRYFPDKMLDEEQRTAAAQAKNETDTKLQMLREGKRPTNKDISDFLESDMDIQESLRDNRSNREILVNALESTAKNDTEKQILEDYKQMADTLDMFESLKKEKQKAMRTSVR